MSDKPKIWPVIENEQDEQPFGYLFLCPGCGHYHSLSVTQRNEKGAQWQFNGSLSNPSFTPSLRVSYITTDGGEGICHSFIRDGYIRFLNDCTHKMAGVTTELLEID